MSEVDVAAIREALRKATAGSWSSDPDAGLAVGEGDDWRLIGELDYRSDANLIVLLRKNAEAPLAAAEAVAPDGTDGHTCVRVEAYTAMREALERAQAASEGLDMLIAQAERRGAVKALRLAKWDRLANAVEKGAMLPSAESVENGALL